MRLIFELIKWLKSIKKKWKDEFIRVTIVTDEKEDRLANLCTIAKPNLNPGEISRLRWTLEHDAAKPENHQRNWRAIKEPDVPQRRHSHASRKSMRVKLTFNRMKSADKSSQYIREVILNIDWFIMHIDCEPILKQTKS